MVGFAYGGLCFETQQKAALYECGSNFPFVAGTTATTYTTVCTGVSATGGTLALRPYTNATAGTAYNRPAVYPVCDESEWLSYQPWSMTISDSMLISAAVIGVWLLAAGWRAIRRPVDES